MTPPIDLSKMPQEFWVALGISLIIYLLFLFLNAKIINQLPKHNRTISPWLLLLMLLPIINIIFHFIWVHWLSKSLFNHYNENGWDTKHLNITYNIGMGFCIFTVLNLIPQLAAISSFVATVLFIAYAMQLMKIYRQIKH